ncbi:NAD(P)-dependent iron-only hydrogenase catalytic subunit [Desulfotomaculum arcticum]|uniref:NAD(P)-dependent iron-only hydrogenase catalytic subunit n=1 Tax=Desulfotruncus arcticus DSM 17038 TaxID=1121424 RepID=A0A1I2ZK72_9FIRM|nr:NADH-dependent [FeFe] hydrogenase, group A6 [Desulfotruncus arcticus]SFH38218.1 NAD(P)-dependent iron-only hydrogenase catalytic subunit [Desulfotomaculum arcticum] [Desulfotruncus arcticus DSM 17038]
MQQNMQNINQMERETQVDNPKVSLWINNQEVTVPANTPNLLEAARATGIEIPSLCYLQDINAAGSCRICLVEVESGGRRSLQASCVYPVQEGLKVFTNTPRVRRARKRMLELLLSEHDLDCVNCIKNRNCELQKLADDLGVRKIRLTGERLNLPIQNKNPFIVRDYNKCIKCRRCEAICKKVQGVNVYSAQKRGFNTVIAPAFMHDLTESDCIACGQCLQYCPTAALAEREYFQDVWDAIEDPQKIVVVQTAPAAQVSIGEMFGMSPGTIVTGKMVSALRRIGFDYVFSTVFAADLTVVEEANELLERLKGNGKLPLISSCSPGWVRYCEKFFPEYVDNLSSCKSPQEMLGALVKTYFAEKNHFDPEKLVVVAVMPCTAKKFEAARPEMVTRGTRDVDYVLTVRELGRMIREAGIKFASLPDNDFDDSLGISTGAGTIFGTTGGVMEAAIRTAFALVEGSEMPGRIDFKDLRGMKGTKEATVQIGGQTLRIAVAHGTRNARRLMERVKAGEKFHFIEIMGCPGGCVGGGGQPISIEQRSRKKSEELRRQRAQALYSIDINKKIRLAHENPAVKELYKQYLDHPLSKKAKEILHVKYKQKEINKNKLLH